jgi:hypothetical protein
MLAQQHAALCCRFVAAGLRCVAAFGGLSKFEQFKELKSGGSSSGTGW